MTDPWGKRTQDIVTQRLKSLRGTGAVSQHLAACVTFTFPAKFPEKTSRSTLRIHTVPIHRTLVLPYPRQSHRAARQHTPSKAHTSRDTKYDAEVDGKGSILTPTFVSGPESRGNRKG
jgi:hypothetical protein